MAKAQKVQLPPPDDENEFEDICEDIAKELWQDPTAKRYGTKGHEQFGIDIVAALAKEAGETRVLAIQSKKKKRLTDRKLTTDDIDGSLKKAAAFKLPLFRLVMATTSSIDATIQSHANTINVERDKRGEFPVEIWFWEDITKLLQEDCPRAYVKFLVSILPEDGKGLLSEALTVESLRATENLIKDNFVEQAKGAFSVFEQRISKANGDEIAVVADRVRANLLIKDQKVEEATTLLKESVTKYELDIPTKAMLFERYISVHDLKKAEQVLDDMRRVDAVHPYTRNADLSLKLNKGEEVDLATVRLEDNEKKNSHVYLIGHLVAATSGDRTGRAQYLEKHKRARPHSPSPVMHEIIYEIWDTLEMGQSLTLEKAQQVSAFVVEREEELKSKNPMSNSQEFEIAFEKLRLDVLLAQTIKPRHEVTTSLKAEAISKVCATYFDHEVYHHLIKFLRLMPLDKQELSRLVDHLKSSGAELPEDLATLFMSQGLFNDKTGNFAKEICEDLSIDNQLKFLAALQSSDTEFLLQYISTSNEEVLHTLIAAIPDHELTLELLRRMNGEFSEEMRSSLAQLKVCSLILLRGENSLEEIKREIKLEEQSFHLLNEIAGFSESQGQWDVEAECLRHMLKAEIEDLDKAQLEARLAVSLFKLNDSTGVLERREAIFKGLGEFSGENQKGIVKVLVISALQSSQLQLAYDILTDAFSYVSDEFEFHYHKSDIELKLGEHENALTTIMNGLHHMKTITSQIYEACFLILTDLSNLGLIANENESKVDGDVYVKISNIPSWFYVGEGSAIDAIELSPEEERRVALAGKSQGEIISWPADQFKNDTPERAIECIFSEALYVRARCQEAFHRAAEDGSAHIWSADADNPEQAIENMKKLWEKLERPHAEFFDGYKNSYLPFSLLEKMEGGIGGALGQLVNRREGFIHINDGAPATQQKQRNCAKDILDGAPVFIDALAAFFLINAKLDEVAFGNIENLRFTPSVPATIREHASQYAQSPLQKGRVSFGKNQEISFFDYDHQHELEIKNLLLEGADRLEENAIKDTKDLVASKQNDFENMLSAGFADPYALARNQGTNVISDDFYYHQALQPADISSQPFPISSLALIEVLHERGKISTEEKLNYTSFLLMHRCRLITMSAAVIEDAIFAKMGSSLISIEPKNVRKLHIDLTLSLQYGVSGELASDIISNFLNLIIRDHSVTLETFEEILAEFLVSALRGRDKSFGDVVLSKCDNGARRSVFIIEVTNRKKKYEIIASQVSTYFSEYNPLLDTIPVILARSS